MDNKKILLGMLAIFLVFGFTLTGCEYGDPGLEGTWKQTRTDGNDTTVITFTFTSGDVEVKTVQSGSANSTSITKGTYVASNGKLGLTFTSASLNGSNVSSYNTSIAVDYVIYGSTLITGSYGVFTRE
jgi:hypothetical protein